jgi:hypothetical protein
LRRRAVVVSDGTDRVGAAAVACVIGPGCLPPPGNWVATCPLGKLRQRHGFDTPRIRLRREPPAAALGAGDESRLPPDLIKTH